MEGPDAELLKVREQVGTGPPQAGQRDPFLILSSDGPVKVSFSISVTSVITLIANNFGD